MTGFFLSICGTRRQTAPEASCTAPTGQLMPQTPQSTQRRAFMTCRDFGAPSMAWTGQARAQEAQPMQFSPIVWAMSQSPLLFAYHFKA